MKIWSFSCKAKYARLRTRCGRRVRFRSSSVWNAARAPRFLARFWPWPFGLSPMAGIITSQPMSKITLRRMFPLDRSYYTTKQLMVEQQNFRTPPRWRLSQLTDCAGAAGVFWRHAFCFSRKAVAKPVTAPLPEHPLSGHPSAGGYACRWFVQLHKPTRSESESEPMTKAKRRGRRADCRPRARLRARRDFDCQRKGRA